MDVFNFLHKSFIYFLLWVTAATIIRITAIPEDATAPTANQKEYPSDRSLPMVSLSFLLSMYLNFQRMIASKNPATVMYTINKRHH